jgi:hypothetical protein
MRTLAPRSNEVSVMCLPGSIAGVSCTLRTKSEHICSAKKLWTCGPESVKQIAPEACLTSEEYARAPLC